MLDNILSRQNIQKIVAVVAMISMSACSYARPNARILGQSPDGAPALYKQGWADGCESGMAIAGNQLYKAVYRNRINTGLVSNTQYYRGWNEAKTYCAHYTMATLWEAGTLVKTPTEEEKALHVSKNVFAVAASWGAPTAFNFQGTEPDEEEGYGFAGFYRN